MFERKKLMWLYGLTSAHVGSGDNLSYIDLPIQREIHTQFPKIEASSLKGSMRHVMEQKDKSLTCRLLGNSDNGDFASAVAISDARILFFPVKSAKGIFAWVTCPTVVQRFQQDYPKIQNNIKFSELENGAFVCKDSKLVINNSKVMLEELTFKVVNQDTNFENWVDAVVETLPLEKSFLEKEVLKPRIIMISDDDFEYFVTQSTEVVTRIKIANGVAEDGALFTEEYLPSESILYSLLFFTNEKVLQKDSTAAGMSASKVEEKMGELMEDNLLQIGGNKTLGKGLFKISWEVENNVKKNK